MICVFSNQTLSDGFGQIKIRALAVRLRCPPASRRVTAGKPEVC
jgi:hypothetical protein